MLASQGDLHLRCPAVHKTRQGRRREWGMGNARVRALRYSGHCCCLQAHGHPCAPALARGPPPTSPDAPQSGQRPGGLSARRAWSGRRWGPGCRIRRRSRWSAARWRHCTAGPQGRALGGRPTAGASCGAWALPPRPPPLPQMGIVATRPALGAGCGRRLCSGCRSAGIAPLRRSSQACWSGCQGSPSKEGQQQGQANEQRLT